jgi:hypothetical protein
MVKMFFDGMTPGHIAIVGGLVASVFWMFVVVWLMDHESAEREQRRQMSATWMSAARSPRRPQ